MLYNEESIKLLEGEDYSQFLKLYGDQLWLEETLEPSSKEFLEIEILEGIECESFPIPVIMNLGYPIATLLGLVTSNKTMVISKYYFEILAKEDLINIIRYSALITRGVEIK